MRRRYMCTVCDQLIEGLRSRETQPPSPVYGNRWWWQQQQRERQKNQRKKIDKRITAWTISTKKFVLRDDTCNWSLALTSLNAPPPVRDQVQVVTRSAIASPPLMTELALRSVARKTLTEPEQRNGEKCHNWLQNVVRLINFSSYMYECTIYFNLFSLDNLVS